MPAADGDDPDVRFSLANERTFLAWNRTALALVAAGLAVVQLLPDLEVPGGREVIGLPLILFGVLMALAAYRRYEINERAMRRGEPLPRSRMPIVLAVGIASAGVIAGVLALAGDASN